MNHTTRSRIIRGTGISFSFGLLMLFIAGCGPTQKEMMAKDQVERANKAYAEASGNPNVNDYAPIQLQDAGRVVQEAQQAKEPDDMIQLGYIAERKTQMAVTVAEAKVAEREMEKAKVEKAQLLTQKQAVDAERAKREALTAQSEAERARMQARSETEKAAVAKRQAEQALQQTEQARKEVERAQLAAQKEAKRAAEARADADQLMKELADLKAMETERGIVLTIGDVLFAFGKADLSSKANRNVEKLADFLKKYTNRNVLIEGHTDSIGSDEYNLELSRKRGGSVRDKLVEDGIEPDRITTVGYGEKHPVVSNDTEANRALNRRVEVIILNEGVKAETQIRE